MEKNEIKYIKVSGIMEYTNVLTKMNECGYTWSSMSIQTHDNIFGDYDENNYYYNGEETTIFIDEDEKTIYFGNISEIESDEIEITIKEIK